MLASFALALTGLGAKSYDKAFVSSSGTQFKVEIWGVESYYADKPYKSAGLLLERIPAKQILGEVPRRVQVLDRLKVTGGGLTFDIKKTQRLGLVAYPTIQNNAFSHRGERPELGLAFNKKSGSVAVAFIAGDGGAVETYAYFLRRKTASIVFHRWNDESRDFSKMARRALGIRAAKSKN